MVDSLTEEEKESLSNMARNMAKNMPESMNQAAQNFQQELEEEDNALDYIDYLGIDENLANDLDGQTLSMLESGSDMEQYYSDIEEADLSASVLFYTKALLSLCRKYAAPRLADAGLTKFERPETTTLYDYAWQLGQSEAMERLSDEKHPARFFADLSVVLMQAYVLLQRAEYEFISQRDLQVLKDAMFSHHLLADLYSLKKD